MKRIIGIISFLLLIYNNIFSNTTNTTITNKKKEELKKNLKFWEKTLKYGTLTQKKQVINYIQLKKIKEAENMLLNSLSKEDNADIQKQLITALITFSNSKVIKYLDKLFKKTDKDKEMKIFLINSYGDLKYKKSYNKIIKYLNDKEKRVKIAAIRTLGKLGIKEAVNKLINMLETENDKSVRNEIILALANIKSETAQDKLIEILKDDEETELNRAFAITGLGYLKNNKSYDILIKYYKKVNPKLKVRIIEALGNIGNKKCKKLLMKALEDDDKNIRIYAIKSIVKLNIREAIEALKYKKDYDPEYIVRKEAEKALEKFKGAKNGSNRNRETKNN